MPSSALSPASRLIPAHMDRLPWSRVHTMVIVGLGTAWILDGIEVQIVAANGFAQDLGMSTTEITASATFYLLGQVLGALLFGRLTDRIGRKKLFVLTLAVYLIGSGLAGAAFSLWFFYLCRFIAGAGIGGEYSAINSAIDELIPAKYRGRVDLALNGTYWAGVALGAVTTIFLLNPALIDAHWSWRIGFFLGPVLGLVLIVIRRHIPESPRWMLTHGHAKEVEEIAASIEHDVASRGIELEDVDESQALTVKAEEKLPLRTVARVFLKDYPQRTILGATLMITQSFLFNAIFFTYAIVLGDFYDVPKDSVGLYMIPFAIGNLLGSLLLGRFFDTIGRRKMIFATYGIAALVLTASAFCFQADLLTPTTHTIFWCVAFFFASAGASAAYLTVSEIFPLEVRGQAISYFFSIAQICGAIAPLIYGALIGDASSRGPLTIGYIGGAAVMLIGGIVALAIGVDAENKGLEDIADPLSTHHAESEEAHA
ncbi:MFS transporter [Brachybacterium nesterenkovii]|uniref:Transporter permease n=1 Tax=Brachybacterium nesterenkovii TaxID=47847 RepID=A0A1X6X4K8_9MICO|nr:MFS transporter [Brachybacterium nesterenkovii]SLM93771.1 transporter permease [Brachybacterium nesterenkovii]